MKQYLLPLSVSSSVTLLFIYACYACFFPDFSSQPLPVSQFSNPAKPSKQTAAIPTGLSEAIASREYYISYDRARQMLQSPNRKHNLRAYYRPGKLTIQNRVDSPDQNFSLVLKNEGILADGCLIDRPDPAAEPEVIENRLLIHHSEFTEEFINNEDGVRQNFIVRQAPAGTKELEVKLAAQGLRIQNGSENDLLLFSKNDKSHPRLLYRDLRCWDAQNQPLTAHMTGKDQQILITVDVRNAAYPVTIDPIVINGNSGNADALLESDQADALFGFSVASAGDVNGDGYSDVLVGCYTYDNGQKDEGHVFVYHGGAEGIGTEDAGTIINGKPFVQMGLSVASAGDINGDGYDDVVIGAPYYDEGQAAEGAAFVYHGSAIGLTTNVYTTKLQKNQADSYFGGSVAGAGDVNGDGYDDILIGAKEYTLGESDEGVVFLYSGSNSGVDDDPAAPLSIQMNKADADFGFSVAGAGDVNRDGYDDVIVGDPYYSEVEEWEGAVLVFYGSTSGINSANPIILQSNIAVSWFGMSVSTAGDINGDGFGDIAAGLYYYQNGQKRAAHIYYGSTSGIIDNSTILEGSGPGNGYFARVSSAGDVNGDGYSDLLVGGSTYSNGQNTEGVYNIYLGSATGITNTHYIKIESNQDSARLGSGVASAGDINADGYADIIVGAFLYDNGQLNEGRASVYYGNSALGLRNNLRLYNSSDLSTPINHTQFPQANFGAGLFAKSFTGRNKGKLVWETKPLGQGFSKGSNNRITNSTQTTGSQNAYSNLGTTGFELKNVIDKQGPSTKVRVRVKYDPVLALTGQSYGPWRYLPAYLMGNSTAPTPEETENDLSENTRMEDGQTKNETRLERTIVYPNPVADRLNIDVEDRGRVESLRILTATGTMVYQSNGFQSFVDVSKFSEGAYFLTILKTDGTRTTRKILIRR